MTETECRVENFIFGAGNDKVCLTKAQCTGKTDKSYEAVGGVC